MHKYAIAAAMTRILRDPIGRWVRDGFNNKDEGPAPMKLSVFAKEVHVVGGGENILFCGSKSEASRFP